jgi:hypothetical protein
MPLVVSNLAFGHKTFALPLTVGAELGSAAMQELPAR